MLINALERGMLVDTLPSGIDTDDPDDAFLLALADAARADVLITGEKRAGLLQRGHHETTRILAAAAFCRECLGER
jgi:predicted nucleic acid-binding protein